MPETPVVQLTDSLTSQPPSQKLANTKNLFAEDPLLDISGYLLMEVKYYQMDHT